MTGRGLLAAWLTPLAAALLVAVGFILGVITTFNLSLAVTADAKAETIAAIKERRP